MNIHAKYLLGYLKFWKKKEKPNKKRDKIVGMKISYCLDFTQVINFQVRMMRVFLIWGVGW